MFCPVQLLNQKLWQTAEEANARRIWHGQLPADIQSNVSVQAAWTLCVWTVECVPSEEQSLARTSVCLQTVPLHRDGDGDAYVAADSGHVTLLSLLDLSATFDTVVHSILMERLRRSNGVVGRAWDWLKSYFTGLSQFVCFNGEVSAITPVTCGVPEGSVVGAVLFFLYAAGVIKLVEECGLSAHAYADELQVYRHVSPAQSLQIAVVLFCFRSFRCTTVLTFVARWRHNFREIAVKKFRKVQKSAEKCVRTTSYR